MSYATLTTQTDDDVLQARVVACASQEAWENPTLSATTFGATVRSNPLEGARLMWPVCLATEAEYASALAAGNPEPGGDEAVISDAMILSAVQANWTPG